jgi:hypothetical protein
MDRLLKLSDEFVVNAMEINGDVDVEVEAEVDVDVDVDVDVCVDVDDDVCVDVDDEVCVDVDSVVDPQDEMNSVKAMIIPVTKQ